MWYNYYMTGLYTSSQVIKLTAISSRQILYWVETGLIKPILSSHSKRATKYFSFVNLVECRTIKSMLEQGTSVQAVRKTLNYLRAHYPELKNHLSEFKLITNGKDIFVINKDGKGIKTPSGQLVMLIPFGDYYKEVKSLLKKNAIKPAISESDALKFVSDLEFWNSEPVTKYIEKEVRKMKNEKSFSLDDIKKAINISCKHKQA